MPDATTTTFNLDDKTPPELEARRRELVLEMTTKYKGYSDPDVPTSLLSELVVITSTLRRKNAGPPKPPKAAREKGPKASIDDLMA